MIKKEILDQHLEHKCCDREIGYIDDYGVYEPIENAMEEYAKQQVKNAIKFFRSNSIASNLLNFHAIKQNNEPATEEDLYSLFKKIYVGVLKH